MDIKVVHLGMRPCVQGAIGWKGHQENSRETGQSDKRAAYEEPKTHEPASTRRDEMEGAPVVERTCREAD
jgi:hypothetical protein